MVSWGIRVETSASGVSRKETTLQPPHYLISVSIARPLGNRYGVGRVGKDYDAGFAV